MKSRARYKNIINKSKGISENKTVGDPFDLFVKSMPEGLEYYKDSNNYRLKAAWEAYGKPKDAIRAYYEGLIDVENNKLIMPSIGYNTETDSYEYLNTGKENDIVNKDIRVWENDTIPFVKELKLGGYIRTFNEELNCWMYTKNSQKRELSVEDKGEQIIDSFLKGGKTRQRKYKTYEELKNYLGNRASEDAYDLYNAYNDDDVYFAWEDEESKNPGTGHWPDTYKLPNHPTFSKDSKYSTPYGAWEGGEWTKDQSGKWTFKTSPWVESQLSLENLLNYLRHNEQNPMTLIYGGKSYEIIPSSLSQSFKQGGQMNVIPEGALHARKNNMELAKEGEITHKGIPVVDKEGGLVAEVEKEEITFTKPVTEKLEDWYKKFYAEDTSDKEKDELAIKCGKFLTKEILFNTDDRVGLIEKIKELEGL